MIENRKFITYISSRVPKEKAHEVCSKLSNEFPVNFFRVENVSEIFSLLSNTYTLIDFIVVDIEDIFEQLDVNSFYFIRTLHTLIKCTVYKGEPTDNSNRRKTKIVALMPDTVTKKLIKEVSSIEEIDFLSLRYSEKVSYDIVKHCVKNYINNGDRIPKYVHELAKNSKPQKVKPKEIKLTFRQQQVFDILVTRGTSNKQIGNMLSITESTVKLHVSSIFKKYGVKNRTQLAVFSKK